MRLSKKSEYALLTVMDMAAFGREGLVRAGDVAKRQGLPLKFLEQILLLLRDGGVVASHRGARGGYQLAVSPLRLTVGAVVRLMQGRPDEQRRPTRPAGGHTPGGEAKLVLQELVEEVDMAVTRKVEGVTIADLCQRVADRAGGEVGVFEI